MTKGRKVLPDLDSYATYERFDRGGMGTHLSRFPSQCRRAWRQATEFVLPESFRDVKRVVVLGMGGSAIGADLVRGLLTSDSGLVSVIRDYNLRAEVDRRTLVVASSYSGMTEETLSAFEQALTLDCLKLVLTSGGKLSSIAEANGVPVFHIDYEAPPRAALAWSFVPLLVFLKRLGMMTVEDTRVMKMARLLDRLAATYGTDAVTAVNQAKKMANKLCGRLVVVYGADFLTPVALRWKTQLNENAKSWAFYEIFPELNHNAIEGYEFPRLLKSGTFVVMLWSSFCDERLKARYEVTADILHQSGVECEVVSGQGDDRLSHMMSLVYLGDWVSYYLAMLNRVDPSPVDRIAYLKKSLSVRG